MIAARTNQLTHRSRTSCLLVSGPGERRTMARLLRLLALASLLVATPATAQLSGVQRPSVSEDGLESCPQFVEFYDSSGFPQDLSKIGEIVGYNFIVSLALKYYVVKNKEAAIPPLLVDLINPVVALEWIASWCRSNPDLLFVHGIVALAHSPPPNIYRE